MVLYFTSNCIPIEVSTHQIEKGFISVQQKIVDEQIFGKRLAKFSQALKDLIVNILSPASIKLAVYNLFPSFVHRRMFRPFLSTLIICLSSHPGV